MTDLHTAATRAGMTHHTLKLEDVLLYYASAGDKGSPVLLVHGWPETWWAFRAVVPLLARSHRVYAVDLRGFGDSTAGDVDYSAAASAEDLHRLVDHLEVGPVHLVSQDLGGAVAFRFALLHPDQVLSFTGIETTFPGFGMEMLADVNHGGSWHLSFFGTPGIAEMLLPGHERALLEWAYTVMGADEQSVTPADLDEFERSYARPNAERGPAGLYRSLFDDDGALRALAEATPLAVPVLAVDGPNHPFTATTLQQVTDDVTAVHISGVGHLVAQQAPEALADTLLRFLSRIEQP